MNSTIEVLQKSKDILIRQPHWWRGANDGFGGHCAVTAVLASCGWVLSDHEYRAKQFVAQAISGEPEIGAPTDVITRFNDDPATQFSDLMAVFDDAILLAKEAEAA